MDHKQTKTASTLEAIPHFDLIALAAATQQTLRRVILLLSL